MKKMPLLKRCAFCRFEGKLSREHVFAEWLEPYLPNFDATGHTTSQNFHSTDLDGKNAAPLFQTWKKGVLQNPKAKPSRQKLEIVCEDCNSIWMSRIQDQVKPTLLPMIHGKWPSPFSIWDRRILAVWGTMFTMVVEHADSNTQASTFEERERLRLWLEPPPNWFVFIGLKSGPMWQIGFNHFGWDSMKTALSEAISPAGALAAGEKEMQSTGWIVGPLYFQTFSSRLPEFIFDPLAFAEKHGLRLVWPMLGLPIDRPSKVLDDIDADNASAALLPAQPSKFGRRRAWEIWGKNIK
jgi:hypothetical protein